MNYTSHVLLLFHYFCWKTNILNHFIGLMDVVYTLRTAHFNPLPFGC